MRRLIFVPQYPTPMRYQELWLTEFPKQFRSYGYDVITLGEIYLKEAKKSSSEMFSPITEAIEFETEQIREYMNMNILPGDTLFVADISFPGFFCNVFYHKVVPKMFAFCHATSLNNLDYFEPVFTLKYPAEISHSRFFDKVFVGSNYHKKKLKWDNMVVTRLPFLPVQPHRGEVCKFGIVSVSRPTPQKVDEVLENLVVSQISRINRRETNSWEEYYKFLSESEVLLITAKEETFGYQVIDAIINGCIPIAPKKFSYPELLPKKYLYSNKYDLLRKLRKALNGDLELPKILCEKEMKDFYRNIIQIMKGE